MSSNVNPAFEAMNDDDDTPVLIRPIEGPPVQPWPRDEVGNKLHWRTLFKVHPAADVFPMLPDDELAKLVDDVTANDLQQAPVFWESPDRMLYLLDGRNRLEAAMRADIKFFWICGFTGWSLLEPSMQVLSSEVDPVAFVISANVHRRHLTAEQKRDLIAKLLMAQPETSNRTIAKQTKTDHKTVGAMRDTLEGRGEIPHVEKATDTKGRAQPTHKPSKAKGERQKPGDASGGKCDSNTRNELDEMRGRIAELLRDASKEQRMDAIEMMMKAVDLNIHDWVSTMTIRRR